MKDTFILAIESSCDETSAAVVVNGRKVLSNVISSQIDIHKKFGGVVPEVASRMHIEAINWVVEEALKEADVTLNDIDAIGVTYGPGLVGALLVGLQYAKGLAYSLDIPLIGVNHIEGHICANFIQYEDLEPPFVTLVVSGGHTFIVYMKDFGEFEVIGQTRDDAVGEAYDKVARAVGLGYPGGPKIDKLAKEGNEDAIKFPKAKFNENTLDFSFSGVKSAVLNYLNKMNMQNQEINKADVVASFQKAVVDVLCENVFETCKRKKINKIAIAGGVASNSYLRKRLIDEGNKKNISILFPEPILCTDNAAMIGSAAYFELQKKNISTLDLNAKPNLKLGGAIGGKMNLLRNSNSIIALKKKPMSPFKIIKNIILIVSVILLSTSLISFVYLKIMDEKYVSNSKFIRIDGKKYNYNIEGSGNYTVILDTVLGADMKATEELSSKIAKKYDCRVFTYNRMGYSYNESTDIKSIENQAEDLRMILKKAGVSGPYVLVGEEYGSLVMGAFAKLYPDRVAGMSLLNPLTKEMLEDKAYMKKYSSQKLKRNFEKTSSYLGIEIILNKVGLLDYPDGYEELLSKDGLKETRINRIRPSYTYSYYSELMNILNFTKDEFNTDIFKTGLIKDKPVSILSKPEYRESQEKLMSITTKEDETHSFLSEKEGTLTMRDVDGTYEAISYVLDRIKLK